MKKIIVLVVLLSGFAVSSFAQVAATAVASANIITPISISKTSNLVFGNLALNPLYPGGGTIILDPSSSGSRTASQGITLPGVTGTPSAAEFNVAGANSTTYSISIPSTVVITDGTNNMNIGTFLTSIPGIIGTLSGGGLQSFYVGGTLTIGAAQPAALYTGNLTVTVNYN